MLMQFAPWMYRARGLFPFLSILVILVLKFATSSRVTPTVYLTCLILSFLMLGFRLWAAGFMGTAAQTRDTYKDVLVTAGPYAYVRNPMYLAAMLLGLLYVIMSGLWYSIFVWIVGYVYIYFQVILYEEGRLHKKFGQNYEEYCQRVPRLIPTLKALDIRTGDFELGNETVRNALAEAMLLSIFWFLYWRL